MRIENYWYSWNWLAVLLLPLSLLFALISNIRRALYKLKLLKIQRFDTPVIVVGNIMVGGVGKTPLVLWLANTLRQKGYKPGIVSRGYGGNSKTWPQQVRADSDASVVGDEPILLARRTECPVCVGPDRVAAVTALLAHTDCDLVISDDGLQHYALARDIEIVVMDGERRFGNGLWLPAGPLRERPGRLKQADMTITNGGVPVSGAFNMQIRQPRISQITTPDEMHSLTDFQSKRVHAIAAIGYPERFFKMLRKHGLVVVPHPFPDHYNFTPKDLEFDQAFPILMTEKDEVKCSRMKTDNMWVVRVDAQPDAAFIHRLDRLIKEKGFAKN